MELKIKNHIFELTDNEASEILNNFLDYFEQRDFTEEDYDEIRLALADSNNIVKVLEASKELDFPRPELG